MGAYESSYAVTKKETIKGIKPSNAEWLFRHAESVDMPISQVWVTISCRSEDHL